MKLGQSVCLDDILYMFEKFVESKSRSVRQIIKDLMLFSAMPHNPEGSGEGLQGHHGPPVYEVGKIKGKGGNGGYQLFPTFQQCFQKSSFLGLLKVGMVYYRVMKY